MTENILEIKNLHTSFDTSVGKVKAVRGVDFTVGKKEVVGIVGESGSGKSVTVKSIMQLLPSNANIDEGEIIFCGENLKDKSEKEMTKIRGNDIAMIFQDPMAALNPVYTIGDQIVEVIRRHQKLSKYEAKKLAIDMLRQVEIPSPEERYKCYPFECSGGMKQRVIIAMALSCMPKLIIADEPTTALDVTIQAQVLDMMRSLENKLDTSIIFVTHDLGVISEICSEVMVMYGGKIMEKASVQDLFENPKQPYTVGLINAIPKIRYGEEKTQLIPIEGMPPDLLNPPVGCPFWTRCDYAMKICRERMPKLFDVGNKHKAACWLLHKDTPTHKKSCI